MIKGRATKNLRLCLACRRLAPREEFWRVVRLWPSHLVQLDGGMGRSAYLCPQSACLKQAQRKDRLSKTLKVKVPPEIYQALWNRIPAAAPLVELLHDQEVIG